MGQTGRHIGVPCDQGFLPLSLQIIWNSQNTLLPVVLSGWKNGTSALKGFPSAFEEVCGFKAVWVYSDLIVQIELNGICYCSQRCRSLQHFRCNALVNYSGCMHS